MMVKRMVFPTYRLRYWLRKVIPIRDGDEEIGKLFRLIFPD
jgi:hypothetical protein